MMISNKFPKPKQYPNFKVKPNRSLNKLKELNYTGSVLKNSNVKEFVEDFESKFKKNKNYRVTKLDKKIEQYTVF